jgi:hypothetical protein
MTEKPNAPGELLPEAGATQERTLETVSSTGLLGQDAAGKSRHGGSLAPDPGFPVFSSLHLCPT